MKKFLVWFVVILVTAGTSVVLTVYLIDTSETPASYDVYHLESEILNEEREIIVSKPANYSESDLRDLPVIYVFGGNSLTYSIAYDVQLLARTGHLEPVIVVGISNISQETRQRDLTPPFMKQDLDEADSPLGEADVYLQFIEEEVIPFIKGKYRASSERIAVGHSREGLMVMYSIIANPNLFTGRLVLSPALWREENIFLRDFKNFMNAQDSVESKLFLSMGEAEVDKMKNAFDLTVEMLKVDSTVITWKSMYTRGAQHHNNAQLSAPIGLEWTLKNN